MRCFCIDRPMPSSREGKNEQDLQERSAVRWLGRVLGPSLIANTPRAAFKASFRAGEVKP